MISPLHMSGSLLDPSLQMPHGRPEGPVQYEYLRTHCKPSLHFMYSIGQEYSENKKGDFFSQDFKTIELLSGSNICMHMTSAKILHRLYFVIDLYYHFVN